MLAPDAVEPKGGAKWASRRVTTMTLDNLASLPRQKLTTLSQPGRQITLTRSIKQYAGIRALTHTYLTLSRPTPTPDDDTANAGYDTHTAKAHTGANTSVAADVGPDVRMLCGRLGQSTVPVVLRSPELFGSVDPPSLPLSTRHGVRTR